jgi:hypothetical protein
MLMKLQLGMCLTFQEGKRKEMAWSRILTTKREAQNSTALTAGMITSHIYVGGTHHHCGMQHMLVVCGTALLVPQLYISILSNHHAITPPQIAKIWLYGAVMR